MDANLNFRLDGSTPATAIMTTDPAPWVRLTLAARYAAPAPDAPAREVARRQLARLTATATPRAAGTRRPSRWQHVPLADLFVAAGNRVHARSNGRLESGHEPVHGSKSGRCVVVDPAGGYWWCSSCRTGGDAIAAVRSLEGCSYPASVRRLIQHYGAPHVANVARQRPSFVRALVRGLVVEVGPCG